jgi:hypothetical protein
MATYRDIFNDYLNKIRNLGNVGFATDDNLKIASLFFDKVIHLSDFKAIRDGAFDYEDFDGHGIIKTIGIDSHNRPLRYSKPTIQEFPHLAELMSLCRQNGTNLIPLFNGYPEFEAIIPQSSTSAPLSAAIECIPIIDVENNSWSVISEIRKDQEMIVKCRRLRNFLLSGLKNTDFSEAEEIILTKISNYSDALKYHGVQTRIGSLNLIFDSKVLTTVIGTGFLATVLGGENAGILSSVFTLAGKITIHITNQNLQRKKLVSAPDGEIAYIIELQERLKSSAPII